MEAHVEAHGVPHDPGKVGIGQGGQVLHREDDVLRGIQRKDAIDRPATEADLDRLGLADRIGERLDPAWMLPAVGQGALGVVCAADRLDAYEAVAAALDHAPTRAACLAERAFLRRLEGGCQIPIAALARVEAEEVVLEGAVASLDGRQRLRESARGAVDDPEAVGLALAERLLGQGAEAILAAIRSDG